ncbi:hypothetical protein Gpo141_00004003 [Globisporangium polare]
MVLNELHASLMQLVHALLAFWSRVQISHRGKYSVERLQALDDYCKTTSLLRVLLVCVLTPVPALLLVISLECLPLKDPSEGWKANYVSWIRLWVMSFTIALGLVYQVRQMISGLSLPLLKVVAIGLSTSGCHIALMVYVSSAWVFPLPFGIVVSVIPFIAFFVGFFLLAIGRAAFKEIPTLRQQLLCQVYIVIAQAVLVLVYPVFSAIFTALSPTSQVLFVLVLPVMKLTMKNVVAWASSHIEEYMPEITVFSVEVFNALYVATCMQSAGSRLTSVFIIAFDAFTAVLALRSIHHHTIMVTKLKTQCNLTKSGLLGTVLDICREPEVFKDEKSTSIRLHSPIRHKLSTHNIFESFVRRQSLVGEGILSASQEEPSAAGSKPRLFGSPVRIVPLNQPFPAPTSSSASTSNTSQPSKVTLSVEQQQQQRVSLALVTPCLNPEPLATSSRAISPVERIELVNETLRLLFHCEYLVLVEYIECAIPLLYVLYLSILFYLPSAKYYPHTRNMTEARLLATIINLLVYIWLEILSFLGLHYVLKWKFGFSPTYQLAFVLEKQMQQLQGRLFVWIVYILQFTLQHFGVDFSFKFAWMHN